MDKMIYGLIDKTQQGREVTEKTPPVAKFESIADEQYEYVQTSTPIKIRISNSNPKELTITMKNNETGDEQVIDYSKFASMVQSGAIKKI